MISVSEMIFIISTVSRGIPLWQGGWREGGCHFLIQMFAPHLFLVEGYQE